MSDLRLEDLGDLRSLETEAGRIVYCSAGHSKPGTPTLCLIASTGRGPDDFAALTWHLVDAGFRVLLPWPRGLGGSTGTLDGIDFHDLAADAAAVLEAERAGPAIIAGHAYGCWIARTVAQDRPDLVDGLILLAAGGGTWPKSLSEAIEVAMDATAPEDDRLAALKVGFFAPGHDPRPWLEGWNGALVKAQREARARTARDSWWSSGRAPILDIIGLQDPFRPVEARDFYVREFGARVDLVTVDAASHALPDEQPKVVADAIAGWIDTQLRDGFVKT